VLPLFGILEFENGLPDLGEIATHVGNFRGAQNNKVYINSAA